MTTNRLDNKLAFLTLCQSLIAGVQSIPDPTLTIDGQTLPKAQVLQPLTDYVAAEALVAPAEAAYHAAVQKAHDAEVPAKAMVANLKPYLKVRLGKSNPALKSQFGVTPAKTPQRTAESKAEAATKAKATRAKNHPKAPKPTA
ncbi:MAG TPA: hypothetical protein VF765_04410 [Polyangiaceae bacterium]